MPKRSPPGRHKKAGGGGERWAMDDDSEHIRAGGRRAFIPRGVWASQEGKATGSETVAQATSLAGQRSVLGASHNDTMHRANMAAAGCRSKQRAASSEETCPHCATPPNRRGSKVSENGPQDPRPRAQAGGMPLGDVSLDCAAPQRVAAGEASALSKGHGRFRRGTRGPCGEAARPSPFGRRQPSWRHRGRHRPDRGASRPARGAEP